MKTVLLLRHAKSSHDEPDMADFNRTLAPRGRKDAPRLGVWIRKQEAHPDLILCSASRRTRETYERLAPEIGGDVPVLFERGLYLAGATTLLGRLRRLSDEIGSVLVIGHNPGLESLAASLVDEESSAEVQRMRAKFPTSGLARLDFQQLHWKDIKPGSGRLMTFVTPADLR